MHPHFNELIRMMLESPEAHNLTGGQIVRISGLLLFRLPRTVLYQRWTSELEDDSRKRIPAMIMRANQLARWIG